ncbi:ATP-dependent DNA helicase [Bacillus cereus]|uniref:ATP-dependent DNA helicase n=1 Tax=Bacillus cereus TaxID=1396 RepID=UPI001879DE79|nr:ATP-dependent DNA helicase [Bacillus cereus]MBE7123472.1 ATP-dependent DNA helicase [Bacillus cereus]
MINITLDSKKISDAILKKSIEPNIAINWIENNFNIIDIEHLSKIVASLEAQKITRKMNLEIYIQIFRRLAEYKQERNDIESYKHHIIRTATDKESLAALIKKYGAYNINLSKNLKIAIELEDKEDYLEALNLYLKLRYTPGILWIKQKLYTITANPKSLPELRIALSMDIIDLDSYKIEEHLERFEKELITQFKIKELHSIILELKNKGLLPHKYTGNIYENLLELFTAESLFNAKQYHETYFELKKQRKRFNGSEIIDSLMESAKKFTILPEEFFNDLSKFKGFMKRENQIFMSNLIHEAISTNNTIMIEAEVGIGKSYGYLIPALLQRNISQKKKAIIISTSSIVLQDQLINKDIPAINNLLKEFYQIEETRSIIGKGKSHFGCSKRIRSYVNFLEKEINNNTPNKAENIILRDALLTFYIHSEFLDENDVDTTIVNGTIWREINANKCNCKGSCKYLSYREQLATHTGIIVCNHQQLLAYLRNQFEVKNGGIFPSLGNVATFIVDEAHKLEDAAKTIFTNSFTVRELLEVNKKIEEIVLEKKSQFKKFDTDQTLYRYFNNLEELNIKLLYSVNKIKQEIPNWLLSAEFEEGEQKDEISIEKDGRKYKADLRAAQKTLNRLLNQLIKIREVIDNINYYESSIPYTLKLSIEIFIEVIQGFYHEEDYISFIEKNRREEWIFNIMRKTYSDILNKQLMKLRQSVILVSGTLRVNNTFNYMMEKVGYTNEFMLPHHLNNNFDYAKRRLVYIPKGIPNPSNRDEYYYAEITKEITRLLNLTEGRSLILFTNFNDLNEIYSRLNGNLEFKLLKQTQNKPTDNLIREFKNNKSSCLLASGSFFEGFDVPGDSLQNVIIVKLPYPVLDPVLEIEIKNAGEFRMQKVLLPKMAIQLNQAIGRLIRREDDKGIVAILDSRLHRHNYVAKEIVFNALNPSNVLFTYSNLEYEWRKLND